MKSKNKLFAALDQLLNTDRFSKGGLKAKGISNETYGRKSCIYISFESPEQRQEVERKLMADDFKVNRGYSRGSSTTEVQVSYFKGFHWDE